jgi:4-hydroxyphenylpyruvate dioxygenase-like putative hemolysin
MKPGPGMFISRYLEKKGDGINHIAFNTKDIERDTQYFIDRGCELVFNVTTNGKTIENYIDTRLHGDLMISLRPSADDWEKSWRKNNESHPMVNDWSFLGLGICVDDLESASAYYSHLGYSQLNGINDRREWGVSFQEYSVSKILFELMQAEKGSIYSSSLKQRGEGVAELIFEVSDLKKEIDRLVGKGAEILQISDDNKTASMGSGMKGNILTRLVQMS